MGVEIPKIVCLLKINNNKISLNYKSDAFFEEFEKF